jgi:hypothetical protein
MNVSYGINIERKIPPRDTGLLAIESPTHHPSDQSVLYSAFTHPNAGQPLLSRQHV